MRTVDTTICKFIEYVFRRWFFRRYEVLLRWKSWRWWFCYMKSDKFEVLDGLNTILSVVDRHVNRFFHDVYHNDFKLSRTVFFERFIDSGAQLRVIELGPAETYSRLLGSDILKNCGNSNTQSFRQIKFLHILDTLERVVDVEAPILFCLNVLTQLKAFLNIGGNLVISPKVGWKLPLPWKFANLNKECTNRFIGSSWTSKGTLPFSSLTPGEMF